MNGKGELWAVTGERVKGKPEQTSVLASHPGPSDDGCCMTSTERLIDETRTPDGAHLALFEEDGDYLIRLNGESLMHSAGCSSELQLGLLALERVTAACPRILIGGLGLGFTLRAVLGGVGPWARVEVVELLPAVIDWNRRHLSGLNGTLLDDPRVGLRVADVYDVLHEARHEPFDAIILDVDNGPVAIVQEENRRLYHPRGIQRLATALVPEGRAAIWSAGFEPRFAERLSRAGFRVETVPAQLHPALDDYPYAIYLADKAG